MSGEAVEGQSSWVAEKEQQPACLPPDRRSCHGLSRIAHCCLPQLHTPVEVVPGLDRHSQHHRVVAADLAMLSGQHAPLFLAALPLPSSLAWEEGPGWQGGHHHTHPVLWAGYPHTKPALLDEYLHKELAYPLLLYWLANTLTPFGCHLCLEQCSYHSRHLGFRTLSHSRFAQEFHSGWQTSSYLLPLGWQWSCLQLHCCWLTCY